MNTSLARKAMDKRLRPDARLSEAARPQRGWIRAIRTALGMTGVQFARRMGVAPSRIPALERGEVEGTLTLASLKKAAAALDCSLVYVLVPHSSLTEMVHTRAIHKANEVISRVNQTMALEAQNVPAEELREDRDQLADELIRTRLRDLWNES